MFARLQKEVNNPGRVYGLDVMRALAALLIVYLHGNTILGHLSPTLASIPLMDGVDLFFALSGFLIGGIILREINKDGFALHPFLKRFWIRRWFRTLPNYYLFLLINILLIYTGLVKDGYLNKFLTTFFVFMQNFHKPYDYLFWESWSLAVEEWFYLLFPLVLAAGLLGLRNNKKMLFLFSSLLFVLFSTIVRFLRAPLEEFDFEHWDIFVRKLVICRLDGIGFGLLAAWVHYYHYASWKKGALALFLAGLAIFVLLLQLGLDHDHYFSVTWYFTLSAIASAFLLPLAEQSRTSSGAGGKIITVISITSYSMYLCNRVVASLIMTNFDYPAHPALFYLLYWVSVILSSVLIYNFFEKPVTNLRERYK
jgi:peptidoglycan/LPS O-acetylase OafA/YrhL